MLGVALLLISCCGRLAGAILWDAKTLCDQEYCSCNAAKSKVTCSCAYGRLQKEIVLEANGSNPLPSTTSVLQVENCHKVSILENAISSLVALRHVEIQHVRRLIIHSNAFNWNHKFSGLGNSDEIGLTTVLKNASLPELPSYAFTGMHTSILLQNLKISVIRPFSFANLDNGISPFQGRQRTQLPYPDPYHSERIIQIRDCDIDNVESLAFRRFSAAEMIWIGGRVGAFHSRALLDITLMGYKIAFRDPVTRPPDSRPGLGINGGLKMQNIYVGRMDSSAFYLLRVSSLQLINATFIMFDRGAISGSVDHPIVRNSFFGRLGSGSFLGLVPDKGMGNLRSTGVTFTFQNNTITKFENASLLFHPAYVFQTEQIRIDRACICSSLWRWTLTLIGHIGHNLNKDSTIVHSSNQLPPEAVALFPALQCRPEDGSKYVYFPQVEKNMCRNGLPILNYSGTRTVIIVVLVSLGFAILVTIGAIVCIRRKRRKNLDRQGKVWIGVPTNERQRKNRMSGACADEDTSSMANGEPRGKEYMVVMPGLKTYHETELHVIVERAEAMSMDGNKREDEEAKSQLLENPDYPDAEKTSL